MEYWSVCRGDIDWHMGHIKNRVVCTTTIGIVGRHSDALTKTCSQYSGLSRKSCRSWSEFWKIQTLICKEMCKKLLVLTKSCSGFWPTDRPYIVSNTACSSCMHTYHTYCAHWVIYHGNVLQQLLCHGTLLLVWKIWRYLMSYSMLRCQLSMCCIYMI